ncbi:cell division protein ZapA [Methyloligella solikamskensis]|uniref:Cell division protein ZapA n=1 Tax=Methyloligella solikamskensis TaxID=1177756 RepID=A0ABW3J8E6_9HYPH
MGQVSVTLNGRTYRLECNNGEEAHLIELSEHLASHVESLKRKFGQIGDDRLILMAALMVTDEFWDMRRVANELKAELADMLQGADPDEVASREAEKELASAIGSAADRLEALRRRIGSRQNGG